MQWPFKRLKQHSSWPLQGLVVQFAATVINAPEGAQRKAMAQNMIESCIRMGARLAVEFEMTADLFIEAAKAQIIRETGTKGKKQIANAFSDEVLKVVDKANKTKCFSFKGAGCFPQGGVDMNEHVMITEVENQNAESPKSEPLASPKKEEELLCDPREVLDWLGDTETIEREEVKVGDWIAAQNWRRFRRVMFIEGETLFLAEPRGGRPVDKGIRRLDPEGWEKRGQWRCYPNLRAIWEAAHSPCNS